MSLIIAGERSGTGKTTVTLALLAFLVKQGLKVQSFKVGPDYIDPMFHQYITQKPCRNLDPVLTSETYIQQCFSRHIQTVDYGLVEGVMGLFDGAQNRKQETGTAPKEAGAFTHPSSISTSHSPFPIPFASTAHISVLLDLPVLLVIDCSRLSSSVAAIAYGFRFLNPNIKIAGLVLNRVGSDRHLELLQEALEPLKIPLLGVLKRQDQITIPDRHLGLVPTDEMQNLEALVTRLADLGENCFNWEKLGALLAANEPEKKRLYSLPHDSLMPLFQAPCPIAVARDAAFNFYYQDNLDLLQELGAELVFWSPLYDALPKGVKGLYFGGGFPEMFPQILSQNQSALDAVQNAILSGMPTYAECGGLMYLCQNIIDFNDQSWPMVGILPTTATMGKRLKLGYRRAVALQDSSLVAAGTLVSGHEFHRSDLTAVPPQPLYQINSASSVEIATTFEGWRMYQLHASYLHLHWGSQVAIPRRFLRFCADYKPSMIN